MWKIEVRTNAGSEHDLKIAIDSDRSIAKHSVFRNDSNVVPLKGTLKTDAPGPFHRQRDTLSALQR